MAALATVARWGFRIATVGSSAVLALAIGTLPAAAARIGFYADATAGAEQLVGVVGGVTGPAWQRSGSAVNLTLPGTITGTQHVSTIAIGTAPLVVTSTTVVPNLNVSQLLGGTWAVPGTIGSTTPNTGKFTTVTATGLTSGQVVVTGASGLLTATTSLVWNGTRFSVLPANQADLGSNFFSCIIQATKSTTVSGTTNLRGYTSQVAAAVAAGQTESGYLIGAWYEAFRNSSIGLTDSSGTLNVLTGQQIGFGHLNTNAVAPVTVSCYGLQLVPSFMTGTITNLYGAYVSTGNSGGTLTNRYGVYIEAQTGAATLNYAIFTNAGKISFGDTTDATAIGTAGVVVASGLTVAKTFGLGSIAAPGSPFDGQVWRDSTQKALIARLNGISQTIGTALFTSTADATVANTVTETSIIGTGVGTKTLPANFFAAGKTIRITVQGYLSSTANPTINIKVKYGSTVLVASGAVAQVGTPSNKGFCVEVIITCRTIGASGTVSAQGYWQYATNVQDMTSTGTTTLDTTASSALDVTATWGVAAAGNTITGTVTTVEVLN